MVKGQALMTVNVRAAVPEATDAMAAARTTVFMVAKYEFLGVGRQALGWFPVLDEGFQVQSVPFYVLGDATVHRSGICLIDMKYHTSSLDRHRREKSYSPRSKDCIASEACGTYRPVKTAQEVKKPSENANFPSDVRGMLRRSPALRNVSATATDDSMEPTSVIRIIFLGSKITPREECADTQ
jgi:hypothetical protein